MLGTIFTFNGSCSTSCSGKSARQVEQLLAARFPKPDVRDSVRRLPTPPVPTFNVESNVDRPSALTQRQRDSEDETASHDLSIPAANRRTEDREESVARCSRPPVPPMRPIPPTPPPPVTAARRLEPLSAGRFGVHFTADAEFKALLERVRELASHRLPGGDLLTLMTRDLQAYARELEKERFSIEFATAVQGSQSAVRAAPLRRTLEASARDSRAAAATRGLRCR
jgi:hypothetical protein